MKQVAFGTGTRAPVAAGLEPLHAQAGRPVETVGHAAVAARGPDGRPTHLALPGLLAAPLAGLYGRRPDGTTLWVADVLPSGSLVTDGTRGDLLDRMPRGVSVVAVRTPEGGILALVAQLRDDPAGGKPHQRAALPTRTVARSADRYAPNPHEVFISGHEGRVLRVS